MDRTTSEIDVCPAQLQDLPDAKGAPGAQEHRRPESLGHRLGDDLQLVQGRRMHRARPRWVGRGPDTARVDRDELILGGCVQDAL